MPNVSIFPNVGEVRNPIYMDIYEYLYKTRDGEWQDYVLKCRTIKDLDERKKYKKTVPTTCLSGEFPYRSDAEIKSHSGVLCMDVDHIENPEKIKEKLSKDKSVFSCFLSISGDGLRILFLIDEHKHREAFLAISKYLFDTYEIVCDSNSSPSKPYLVSFDPYIYINFSERVPVWSKYIKETKVKKINDFVHTADDFKMVMEQIVNRNVSICEEYNDWLKIGFALSEQFGEDGRGFFHQISACSSKYKSVTVDKQFNQCMKARGTGKPVGISSFYYLAKLHNINIVSDQTRTIVRTTKSGKKAGLKKEQIIENLAKLSNIHGSDKLVTEVFDNDYSFEDDEDSILDQVEMFISNNYHLKMNEVTGYLEQGKVVLTPEDLNSIFVAAKKRFAKLDYALLLRLLKSDFVEKYNPFFDFFGSDGIAVELPANPVPNTGFKSPLIDKLASCIENDNPKFTEFFVRKWIVSIVSAAHKVHSPLILVLVGGQNTGKTEWFRRLLPKELQGYYAESKLDKEKDDELLMTENLIVMDDEFGGKSKTDTQKLKNLTSKQWFSLRRPYGDHNEKILRLSVLGGTSNIREVLSDSTGNRRIIPVDVDNVNKDRYNSIDKVELFMEAFRLYKEGFDWRVTTDDITYLNNNQKDYEMTVRENELVYKYYFPGDEFKMSTTEIQVELQKLINDKVNLTILGRELLKLGFEKKSTKDENGMIIKKWRVNKINRTEPIEVLKPNLPADLPF